MAALFELAACKALESLFFLVVERRSASDVVHGLHQAAHVQDATVSLVYRTAPLLAIALTTTAAPLTQQHKPRTPQQQAKMAHMESIYKREQAAELCKRGDLLASRGHLHEAMECVGEGLALHPASKDLKELRDRLTPLLDRLEEELEKFMLLVKMVMKESILFLMVSMLLFMKGTLLLPDRHFVKARFLQMIF